MLPPSPREIFFWVRHWYLCTTKGLDENLNETILRLTATAVVYLYHKKTNIPIILYEVGKSNNLLRSASSIS